MVKDCLCCPRRRGFQGKNGLFWTPRAGLALKCLRCSHIRTRDDVRPGKIGLRKDNKILEGRKEERELEREKARCLQ